VAVSVLVAGLAGCVLSWRWAVDSSSAAILTDRLIVTDGPGPRQPLPETVVPPEGRWVSTTAQHLAHWAVWLSAVEAGEPRSAPDVAPLLIRALHVSPLNPTARLALAQLEQRAGTATRSSRSLGLSRDTISLAFSAGTLLREGKKAAALRLFGRALTVATDGALSRTATPRFMDDLSVRRYLLPGEEAARDILVELTSQNEWTFQEWSRALPRNPTVLLAAARLLRELREQGRAQAEAEPLLELILEGGKPGASGDTPEPRALAARAEALALQARWKEAEQEYHRAIERIDNDTIRRSWWFNLADIASRMDDEEQRQAALRAALTVANSDDITRRATSIQRQAAARSRLRLGGPKAN
jgi:tetratricopeptide (TPR) repeat protein